MKRIQYVLVSQGIEIYRTDNREEAVKQMNTANVEWYEYAQKCLDNNEQYADNEVLMYEEIVS